MNINVGDIITLKESIKDNYIIIAIDSTGIKVTNTEVSRLETNGTLGKDT